MGMTLSIYLAKGICAHHIMHHEVPVSYPELCLIQGLLKLTDIISNTVRIILNILKSLQVYIEIDFYLVCHFMKMAVYTV